MQSQTWCRTNDVGKSEQILYGHYYPTQSGSLLILWADCRTSCYFWDLIMTGPPVMLLTGWGAPVAPLLAANWLQKLSVMWPLPLTSDWWRGVGLHDRPINSKEWEQQPFWARLFASSTLPPTFPCWWAAWSCHYACQLPLGSQHFMFTKFSFFFLYGFWDNTGFWIFCQIYKISISVGP